MGQCEIGSLSGARSQVEESDPLIEDSPIRRKKPKPTKNLMNEGRQMIKGRQEHGLRRRDQISCAGFKFPPTTPKSRNPPVIKLGSGFEGLKLIDSAGSKVTKRYKTGIKGANYIRPQKLFQRQLQLCSNLSPCLQAENSTPLADAGSLSTAPMPRTPDSCQQQPHVGNTNSVGAKTPMDNGQTYDLAVGSIQHAKLEESKDSKHNRAIASKEVRPDFDNVSDDSIGLAQQRGAVRQPSKSERNGWLKRRRKVSFADEIVSASEPVLYDSRSKTCENEASVDNDPSNLIPSDDARSVLYQIPDSSLSIERKISKTIEQLASLAKISIPVSGTIPQCREGIFPISQQHPDEGPPDDCPTRQDPHQIYIFAHKGGIKRSMTENGHL